MLPALTNAIDDPSGDHAIPDFPPAVVVRTDGHPPSAGGEHDLPVAHERELFAVRRQHGRAELRDRREILVASASPAADEDTKTDPATSIALTSADGAISIAAP